jgi:hypothetical protein
MAKTDLSVKIGAQFVGKDAFDKAEKSLKRLAKQGAALALGGSILNFGKNSVQAFYESEKQAKSLYQTLNNLGLAFQAPAVNDYIKKLSLASGIVDDELNPAFQRLLVATKDVSKAQALLKTSLDVSAGTGKGLEATTTAISKAYLGNTTALQRLGVGLTAAQLKAGDFDSTITALNNNFYGQASAAVEGYTGQIDRLGIAYDQLKERVGKAVLDVGGSFARFFESTKAFLGTGWTISAEEMAKIKAPFFNKSLAAGFGNVYDTNKNAKAQIKATNDQVKATKALTAEQKKQALLKKSQGILDLQQIQILAALQNQLTEDEKKRLALQMALLTDNSAEANRLSNELAISQLHTTQLASAIANLPKALNPFADYPFYVQQAAAELSRLGNMMSPTAGNLSNPFVGQYAGNYGAYAESPFTPYSGNPNPVSYNITVNGVVGSASDVSEVIRQELLNQSNTGSNTFVNTLKGIS